MMIRQSLTVAVALGFIASVSASTPGRIKQYGRATVEYRSDSVKVVAAYDYSQRNHTGPWLLLEFAVQATPRIAIHRNQLVLIRPDETVVPLATQSEFLEDHGQLLTLMQNAVNSRQQLSSYFSSRPLQRTIRFFSSPGGPVIDSAITNPDEVATGDLLFKSPNGSWPSGSYKLALHHDEAMAELPIELK